MIPRPQRVRFYVDEDVLGLAKLLASVRLDVTFAGDEGRTHNRRYRPPCEIANRQDEDDVWIPKVAEAGWVIITRDSKIQAHTRLISAVRDSGARMVALAGKDSVLPWDQLRVVTRHWDSIEGLHDLEGPVLFSATRTTFKRVPL